MKHCGRNHRPSRPARGASRRSGFTLLEMLLTLVLTSVLLSSLWGLLAIYSRLFEAGQAKAENAQLITGVLQQIGDDLHGAIQDTAEASPGALGAVRRFGLFGSAKVLQLDVVQTVWPRQDSAATPAGASMVSPLDQPQAGQALELRTIRYTFTPPGAADQPVSETGIGLTRQELDFDTPYTPGNGPDTKEPAPAPEAAPGTMESPGSQTAEEKPPDELSLLESLGPDPNDDRITRVPEVVALEFRYFDGMAWGSTWNSIQRRSLPVAIEVLLEFKAADQGSRPAPPRPPVAEEPADLFAFDEASVRQPDTLARRLLVCFPTSILRHQQEELERAASDASDMPEQDMEIPAEQNDLLANPTDPTYDEAGNRALARAFQGIGRGRPAAPPSSASRDPQVGRTVIDQPAPDQWMRAGPR